MIAGEDAGERNGANGLGEEDLDFWGWPDGGDPVYEDEVAHAPVGLRRKTAHHGLSLPSRSGVSPKTVFSLLTTGTRLLAYGSLC